MFRIRIRLAGSMEQRVAKRLKPDKLSPFVVTIKKAGLVLVRETEIAARASDAEVAVLNRHREISFDEEIEVQVERHDAP
jgi:hypothetical protein